MPNDKDNSSTMLDGTFADNTLLEDIWNWSGDTVSGAFGSVANWGKEKIKDGAEWATDAALEGAGLKDDKGWDFFGFLGNNANWLAGIAASMFFGNGWFMKIAIGAAVTFAVGWGMKFFLKDEANKKFKGDDEVLKRSAENKPGSTAEKFNKNGKKTHGVPTDLRVGNQRSSSELVRRETPEEEPVPTNE